jgi:hypothetical protein
MQWGFRNTDMSSALQVIGEIYPALILRSVRLEAVSAPYAGREATYHWLCFNLYFFYFKTTQGFPPEELVLNYYLGGQLAFTISDPAEVLTIKSSSPLSRLKI